MAGLSAGIDSDKRAIRVELVRFAFLFLFGSILFLVWADPSAAYRRPSSTNCVPTGEIRWRHNILGQSSSADRSLFASSADNWDFLRGSNNNQFVFTLETTSNVNTLVNWVTGVTPNTDCGTVNVIEMDPTSGSSYMAYAAAHEVGHAHGLRHTGRTDNITPDGSPTFPLMGCGDLVAPYPSSPLGDDVAQAFTRFGPRATPNWGFENNLAYWTKSSSAVLTSTTVAYGGTRSAYIPPGEWIRTRVRIAEPSNYAVVAQWRANAVDLQGDITFQLSTVSVNYTTFPFSADGDACPEMNTFTEGTAVSYPVDSDNQVYTSGRWVSYASPTVAVPGSGEGFRGSVWVINNSDVVIRVDNVALEER